MKNNVTQLTSGMHALLSVPFVYALYQQLVFPKNKLVKEYIRPFAGQCILDIGCGTGDILNHLPDVDYVGIDVSEQYIQTAKKHHGHRAHFHCIDVDQATLAGMQPFDLALAIGVFHHISDEEGLRLCQLAQQALKPGGRFIAVEPCYTPDQSRIARWIISKDRGQNVKDQSGYAALCCQVFKQMRFDVRHDLLRIPYTMLVMEGSRPIEMKTSLLEIGQRCAKLPDKDTRSPDEILGYDSNELSR